MRDQHPRHTPTKPIQFSGVDIDSMPLAAPMHQKCSFFTGLLEKNCAKNLKTMFLASSFIFRPANDLNNNVDPLLYHIHASTPFELSEEDNAFFGVSQLQRYLKNLFFSRFLQISRKLNGLL